MYSYTAWKIYSVVAMVVRKRRFGYTDSVEMLFSRNSLTNFCAFASKLIWRMSGVVILSDQSLNSFSISSIEGRVFL